MASEVSEVSPLKSFNKSPGTDEGVEAMPRIPRQDLRAIAAVKEGVPHPHTPGGNLRSPRRGFSPCLSGGRYEKDGERGVHPQRGHGHTDAPSASDTQPRPHTHPPHTGHRVCCKLSQAGLCSHSAHEPQVHTNSHLQPVHIVLRSSH